MKRNAMDEMISALKVARIQTLGMSASPVVALYLFSTDSNWFGTAVVVVVIFTGLALMAAPGIIREANKRAKARHRYLH